MSYPVVHLNEAALREGMQIEIGSFVSPRYTPQMKDMDLLVQRFNPRPGVRYTALALNEKGRQRRAEYMPPLELTPGAPSLSMPMCNTFSLRNTNRSKVAAVRAWPEFVAKTASSGAQEAGIGLAAAWGSNFEGSFSLAARMEALEAQYRLWEDADIPVTWLTFADPMSWCTPDAVEAQLLAIRQKWPSIRNVRLHLHDGRNMAMLSIYAALRALDDSFELYLDVAAGGIGGCPYCGNGRATGMAPTEDLVHMLDSMGIDTGVKLDALIEAVWLLEDIIGRPAMGHVSKAGPRPVDAKDWYDPNLPLVEDHASARHFLQGPDVAEGGLRPWREPIPSQDPATSGYHEEWLHD